MTSGLFYHEDCLDHLTPNGHPECPDRLTAIMDRLSAPDFSALKQYTAEQTTRDRLALVHSPAYIAQVMDHIPENGLHMLDSDTVLSSGSGVAALRAVGGVCQAIDAVMKGEIDNAFCATRPPGHHAEPDRAMGFCLFNTVAIGALYAQSLPGCSRVAVIDFDVHHGNGTQTVAETHENFFYGSSHQSPLYPGTGHLQDQGAGVIVNAPLAAGSGGRAFLRCYETRILPALDDFKPDFILISAGFDGHALDPLADLMLESDDFFHVTAALKERADHHCQGRLVSCLEGGYNLSVLGENVARHISALMK